MLLITSWAISRCWSAVDLPPAPLVLAAAALLMAMTACWPAIWALVICCSAAICWQ
jgi:hypothetical protein